MIYIYIYIYIYILVSKFNCLKAKIGALIKKEPHSLNIYCSNITSSAKRLPGAL